MAVVVALYAGIAYAVQRLILRPSFEQLEHDQAARDMARATEAIGKDVESLDSFCHDWAAWDDTFRFVQDGNQEFIQTNLDRTTFENGNFDLVYVCDLQGRVVWGQVRDPESDWAEMQLAEFPPLQWSLENPLLAVRDPGTSVRGVMLTSGPPVLVSSRPIVDSRKTQAMRGWLVMGRFLTAAHIAQLVEQTRVSFQIWPIGTEMPPQEAAAVAALRALDGEELQRSAGADMLNVYDVLTDINDHPALLLRGDLPRAVMARGERALQFALTSTLTGAVLLLVVLYVLLQRSVIRPLADLTRHAVAVGSGDDLSARIASTRGDELGVLAREFDRMVERLQAARAAHLDAARLGGRSEVASSVLHNVGNVLNSVNVSAEVIRRRLHEGGFSDLDRLAKTLQAHQTDMPHFLLEDERGRHLPAYLAAFGDSLCRERAEIGDELSTLLAGIEHIKALIDAQQSHAGGSGVLERVKLAQQIEGALKLAANGDEASAIAIAMEFENVPDITLNRHKLLEILVNLIRNAFQSLQASGGEAKQLRLCVAREGNDRVRVEVTDNGVGIARDDMSRIFGQGFSRRVGGHGLGLHAAANNASEMGGRLYARSEGPGTGATFVLELSLSQSQKAA